MGDKTAIEWADATWNPIRARDGKTMRVGHHCEKVSAGCAHCYAERINERLGTGRPYKPGHYDDAAIAVFLDAATLDQPFRWRRPRTIFPCSMTDLFARFVDDATILRVFSVMAGAKHHRFIVLTKRPERMRALLARMRSDGHGWMTLDGTPALEGRHDFITSPGRWPLPNVILGTSIENRAALDRLEHLRATPAALRVISAEPLLEDLGPVNLAGIAWVIVGGESGPGARPMHPDWARSIRDQCTAAGVPFFFKQWGEWGPPTKPVHEHMRGLEVINPNVTVFIPGSEMVLRLGKKHAGRRLDGREWSEFPPLTNSLQVEP